MIFAIYSWLIAELFNGSEIIAAVEKLAQKCTSFPFRLPRVLTCGECFTFWSVLGWVIFSTQWNIIICGAVAMLAARGGILFYKARVCLCTFINQIFDNFILFLHNEE